MKFNKENMPKSIAIIMDGNRRWAKAQGKPVSFGHKEGAKTLEKIVRYANKIGLEYITVYAFSTENWKRDKEEVDYLMDLFIKVFKDNFKSIKEKGVKIVFSGVKTKLNDKVLKEMKRMTEETKNNKNGVFNICLNYGGQDEIVEATKKIVSDVKEGKIKIDDINKDMYSSYLFNDLPPIDLMIRTSGEYRISNFMLWQMAYAELYFTDVLWPDFDEKELDKAIDSFNKRDRRFGGVKK